MSIYFQYLNFKQSNFGEEISDNYKSEIKSWGGCQQYQ